MMDAFDLASRLFGNSRAESRGDVSSSLDILTATGAGDSSDGAATVYLDADVTPADDYDDDDYAIGIPTSPNVIEGDGVLVGLTGSGPLKTPVVISNPGSGDRMQVQISNAETLAEQAEAVATATGQHFWSDTDGVHVTEVTQDEWSDSTSPSYHSGANVLLNALGQLFRNRLNNLLAVLTSGIAIYDGNGNDSANILAEFTANRIRLGKKSSSGESTYAKVEFFDGDSSLSSSVIPDGGEGVEGGRKNILLADTYKLGELKAYGYHGISNQVTNDGQNTKEQAQSSMQAMTSDNSVYSSVGALVLRNNGGTPSSRITMHADYVDLSDNDTIKSVKMEQAIAALTTPVTSRSDNISSMSASTDARGGALTLAAGTYLIDIDATIATSSGSGTRSLTVGIYKGGSVASYRTFGESDRAYKRIGITEVMHFDTQTSIQAYIQSSVAVSSASSIRTRAVRLS